MRCGVAFEFLFTVAENAYFWRYVAVGNILKRVSDESVYRVWIITGNKKEAVIMKAYNKTNYKLGMSDKLAYQIAGNIVVKDMTSKEEVNSNVNISESNFLDMNNKLLERRQGKLQLN
mgnify:CR=1 FL=1